MYFVSLDDVEQNEIFQVEIESSAWRICLVSGGRAVNFVTKYHLIMKQGDTTEKRFHADTTPWFTILLNRKRLPLVNLLNGELFISRVITQNKILHESWLWLNRGQTISKIFDAMIYLFLYINLKRHSNIQHLLIKFIISSVNITQITMRFEAGVLTQLSSC